ncbi:UDP-N-acetylmuramate dehydrogenase [Portibacter marinus]|uniref:UDP-N-acetylmuramate dehydrogenase n=1 Tax=Portibacter marinus TaxID=2898660 RepID=UPI001F1FE0D7|nr:UDP-N-acetylmuramate dehydrogenase [Portibacter marinus]
MKKYEDVSLKAYNTFGIDVKCRLLYKISSEHQLQKVLSETDGPYFILGGGSNLLLSSDQELTILKNEIDGIIIDSETAESVILKVGGGVNWHSLVLWAVEHDYGGLENLSLIPGTVGASPIQNIGAYGVELDQIFLKLDAIRIENGKKTTFLKEDCHFGYRDSVFKKELKGQYFITYVYFQLTKSNHKINISYAPLAARFNDIPTIKAISDAVIEIRQSKLPDPAKLGNSGSFFKNPIISIEEFEALKHKYPLIPSYPVNQHNIKVPAGWLIEKAGWKGRRIGDAGSYEKQALVLVNHGNASGSEIWQFAQMIIKDVELKFGITLSPEVNIV